MLNIYKFWSNSCCQVENNFFRQGLAFFSKTISNHMLHVLKWHDNIVKQSKLTCLQSNLSPIANIQHIMNIEFAVMHDMSHFGDKFPFLLAWHKCSISYATYWQFLRLWRGNSPMKHIKTYSRNKIVSCHNFWKYSRGF